MRKEKAAPKHQITKRIVLSSRFDVEVRMTTCRVFEGVEKICWWDVPQNAHHDGRLWPRKHAPGIVRLSESWISWWTLSLLMERLCTWKHLNSGESLEWHRAKKRQNLELHPAEYWYWLPLDSLQKGEIKIGELYINWSNWSKVRRSRGVPLWLLQDAPFPSRKWTLLVSNSWNGTSSN